MKQLTWNPQDAVALRDYLTTESGKKFMSFLQGSVKIQDANSIEEEVLHWRTFKGGMVVLNTIDLLTQDPTPQEESKNVVQFHNTSDTSGSGRSSTTK